MRKTIILLGISTLLLGSTALAQSALPYWAYPVASHAWPQPDPKQPLRLPGTKITFTVAGTNDRFNVPDWYPNSHPKMPAIVAHGRKPDVFACGYCHLPNGQGRPENASLAGQPADYIVQQVAEMRSGARKSSSDKMGSINAMMAVAKASNDAEVKIAADYFSTVKFAKWIRVVETDYESLGVDTPVTLKSDNPADLFKSDVNIQNLFLLEETLKKLEPPHWPEDVLGAIDQAKATQGAALYKQHCASCHDVGGKYTNKPVPPAEIGTDRERMDTWIQAAADEANRRVKEMGINRPNMVKIEGYQSPPLDGIWMRAPYLHNGSVPSLRNLLEPVEQRTKVFYVGYDVYDPFNVGFVTQGPQAERVGWKRDVSVRGDGNWGHNYGTGLTDAEKISLVEYMKTL